MLKLTVYNYWRDANNYQQEKNTPVLLVEQKNAKKSLI